MKMKSVLAALVLTALSLATRPAHAWIHWNMLENEQYKHKLLIYTVLENHHFNYCFQDQTKLIDRDSVKIQVDRAIQVWSRAFATAGVPGVTANLVSCSTADLQIVMGPNPYKTLWLQESVAFVTPVADVTQPLLMHLNVSEKPHMTSYGDDLNLRIIDIKDVLKLSLQNLGAFLDQMSYGGYTVGTLIHEHPELIPNTRYLHLSYGILLHEFGHTFGLGDTYAGAMEVNGSKQWRSSTQPTSLMEAIPYYNLQPDDQKGFVALVTRMRAELGQTPSVNPRQSSNH